MTKLLAFTLVLIAIPVRPDRQAPIAPPTPMDPLLGHWKVVRLDVGGLGQVITPPDDNALQVTPTHMKAIEKGVPQPGQDIAYSIDWSRQPATVDLMPKNGAPKRMEGILRIDGDRMFICFSLAGRRPASFDLAPAEPQTVLMQLQRIK